MGLLLWGRAPREPALERSRRSKPRAARQPSEDDPNSPRPA